MKRIFSPISLLAIMLFSLAVSSCKKEPSSDVNQDKIWTSYELFYNQNTDKTYARATFKFSNALGTLLELDDPAVVTFNGDALGYKPALGYYEKEYAGNVGTGTFVYTDLDNNSFTNSISNTPIAYPAGLDSISNLAAYELFWTGTALGADESVTVTMDGAYEADGKIFYTNTDAATSIILDKNKLETIATGTVYMWMDRQYTPALASGTSAGGTIKGRYRPNNHTVILY